MKPGFKTDPTIHVEMLINTTDGPVFHNGKFFSPSRADSLVSTDPKLIKKFFAGQCLTAGFSIQFAINTETREIVKLFKKGKIAQKDVKALIAEGFTEWTFSWSWSPSFFRFPDGGIVEVSSGIDLTADSTALAAVRLGVALGTI